VARKSEKKKGGNKKYGRNKKAVDSVTSAYVRGVITFEAYQKKRGK
jgi:hypothetical protein